MPPLAKGRWPSEARSEGWERSRKHYRYDRTNRYVSTPQSPAATAPLGKGGREVGAGHNKSAPPLAEGALGLVGFQEIAILIPFPESGVAILIL